MTAIKRPLRRIYLTGLACATLAAGIGIALERARLGSTEADAFARVERSVRSEIATVVAALDDIASSVAREPALFDAAAADPQGGARALLDRADQSLQGRRAGLFAVTAHRPSGARPLAWSGVPSEIEVEQIGAPEGFFVASGPLGLRLVYIKPVLDPSSHHRVGVISAERVLSASRGIRTPESEAVLAIPTIAPVTARPHDRTRANEPNTFVVRSPDGHPLLDARVTPESIAAARHQWRGTVTAVALAILALTLIVSIPPLLRWREPFRRLSDHLRVVGFVVVALLVVRALLWLAPTARWTDQIFHTAALGPALRTLLRTPVDFLLTMALLAAVVLLAFDLIERLRRTVRHRYPPPVSRQDWAIFALTHVTAGSLVALLLVGYEVLLGNAIAATSVDALHFSLHPLRSARLAFAIGLLLAQAVVFWAAVIAVISTSLAWRTPRTGGTALAGLLLQACPVLVIAIFPRVIGAAPSTIPAGPTAFAGLACLAQAWGMAWARPRYRQASQALRDRKSVV